MSRKLCMYVESFSTTENLIFRHHLFLATFSGFKGLVCIDPKSRHSGHNLMIQRSTYSPALEKIEKCAGPRSKPI